MIRTPEQQYLHELIESYVAPLRSEIKELTKQLSTEPVKNNGVLPVVSVSVCPVCNTEHNGGNKHCNDCINRYYDSLAN